MALSNKQRVFIENYLTCWNATESARRAGYAFPNVEGPKNLVKPSIKAIIDARIAELKMSADEVLLRLANMARSNIADFANVRNNGDLANLGDVGQVVKKFKHRVTTTKDDFTIEEVELELHDAQSALVHIGRHHKLFADDTGTDDRPIVVKVVYGNERTDRKPTQPASEAD